MVEHHGFWVTCNVCLSTLNESEGAFGTYAEAEEWAREEGLEWKDGKHICEVCREEEEEV